MPFRIAVKRVCRGSFEEDEVSDKFCILKSKSMPCLPSRFLARQVLYVFVIILSPTSSIFGLGYITRLEKGEKFLTFNHKTVMMSFGQKGQGVPGVSR